MQREMGTFRRKLGSMKKDQIIPQNITSEIKNILDVINSRFDTVEMKD